MSLREPEYLDIYKALTVFQKGESFPLEIKQLARWTKVYPFFKYQVELSKEDVYEEGKDYTKIKHLPTIYGAKGAVDYWITPETALRLCLNLRTLDSCIVYEILKNAYEQVKKNDIS